MKKNVWNSKLKAERICKKFESLLRSIDSNSERTIIIQIAKYWMGFGNVQEKIIKACLLNHERLKNCFCGFKLIYFGQIICNCYGW